MHFHSRVFGSNNCKCLQGHSIDINLESYYRCCHIGWSALGIFVQLEFSVFVKYISANLRTRRHTLQISSSFEHFLPDGLLKPRIDAKYHIQILKSDNVKSLNGREVFIDFVIFHSISNRTFTNSLVLNKFCASRETLLVYGTLDCLTNPLEAL